MYAIATITLVSDYLPLNSNLKSIAYLDIKYGIILVDKTWLSKHLPMYKINIILTFFKIGKIRASKYKLGEFLTFLLYFPDKNNAGQLVYAFLTCEIHSVEGLRANLLIINNIISPEGFVIDVKRKSVLIKSYWVTVPIDVRQKW